MRAGPSHFLLQSDGMSLTPWGYKRPRVLSPTHSLAFCLLNLQEASYPDVFCLLRGPWAKNWQLQPVKNKGLQPNMCKAPNLTQSYGSELGRAFPFPLVLRELQILQHSDCSFWDFSQNQLWKTHPGSWPPETVNNKDLPVQSHWDLLGRNKLKPLC